MSYKPQILKLVIEPDPCLHIKSKLVEEVNDEIRHLMDDMLATMYKNEGIGLAAVQVGIHKKVVVIDIDYTMQNQVLHDRKPIFMVNPTIIEYSKEKVTSPEGCLSLPQVWDSVMRYESILVEYLDYNEERRQERFAGLLSICIQHEIDHTNGTVFIDHLSRLKKEFFIKKLKKLRKQMGYE